MGSSENIEQLWNLFSSDLKSFIISKVKDDADADDILQNTFLKIHDNIHNLKDKSRIKPWIYQITRNLIIDYFRANNRSPEIKEFNVDLAVISPSGKDMDDAINDMIKMMDDMSPEDCEALCLTEIEGIPQKEYAERKGISYSAAKSRIQRAMLKLKDMLLKCCHYQFDKYGTVIDIQPKCSCCCPH